MCIRDSDNKSRSIEEHVGKPFAGARSADDNIVTGGKRNNARADADIMAFSICDLNNLWCRRRGRSQRPIRTVGREGNDVLVCRRRTHSQECLSPCHKTAVSKVYMHTTPITRDQGPILSVSTPRKSLAESKMIEATDESGIAVSQIGEVHPGQKILPGPILAIGRTK